MRKHLMAGFILIALIACVGLVSADECAPTTEYVQWASAGGIVPITDLNKCLNKCSDIGLDNAYMCEDDSQIAIHSCSVGTFTGSYDAINTHTISWSSNLPVLGVIVKDGSEAANAYKYPALPEWTSDSGLTVPPQHWKLGDPLPTLPTYGGISHVIFCYHPGTPSPEFPTLALPVALLIGMMGTVLYIRSSRKK